VRVKQRFSDEILADFRESMPSDWAPSLYRHLGCSGKRPAFVRSWSVKPRGWYRKFLEEPPRTVQIADRKIAVRAVRALDIEG
jgi:hypothetical protein